MTAKKHARKKTAAHHESVAGSDAPPLTATVEELEAQANSPAAKRAAAREARKASTRDVPTYAKDHEVAAARAMYGADYEKLIASGAIVAPTFEELSHDELSARIEKKEKKAEKAEKAETTAE